MIIIINLVIYDVKVIIKNTDYLLANQKSYNINAKANSKQTLSLFHSSFRIVAIIRKKEELRICR